MEIVSVTSSITSGGDGSAYNIWFLTSAEASYHNERGYDDDWHEGWGEECIETVETFEGSTIHKEAIENSKELAEARKGKNND